MLIRIKIANEKSIFIEVLGRKSAEYLLQKQHMKEIALEHCNKYLSVKGYDLYKNQNTEYKSFLTDLDNAIAYLV